MNDSAVRYLHTGTIYKGTEFVIYSGSFPQWTSRVAGQTMSEPTVCDTEGDHLHQNIHVGGNHWENTHYPEMSECDDLCGNYDVMNNYQLEYYWSE